MAKNRTLIVTDCINAAIDRLTLPLHQAGLSDICYHYVGEEMNKKTGFNTLKNPVHFTVELLKDYDQIHFSTIRAVDVILKNKEIVDLLKGKKLIMTIHTERERDLDLLNDKHWNRIDQFVSPTKYQQEKIKEYTGKDSIYIPYAIDEKKYKFIKESKGTAIGYIGRVTPHKRLKEIAEASDRQIIGIGYVDDGRSGYWQSIPKGNLTMYQHLTEDQKIDIMSQFKILVSVSEPHIETGPLGVLECAALGIPIITTIQGWAKDKLKDTCAYFVKDNLDNFKSEINYIVQDKEKDKIRMNARKVIDSWTIDNYVNAHKEIYD